MTELEPDQLATIDPPRAIRVKTSTGWADLAIKGAPGKDGYNGVDLVYHGAWAPGTYDDGDVVIGADGIAYLCVKDATTAAPTPWGGATVQQTGVPLPVVNGQWLKGAGGAAVWAPAVGLFAGDTLGTNVQLQIGKATITVPAQTGGAQTVNVPLARPWPNNHYSGWLIAAWPLSSWGLLLRGWNASGLTGIDVNFDSPGQQNIAVTYASLGN